MIVLLKYIAVGLGGSMALILLAQGGHGCSCCSGATITIQMSLTGEVRNMYNLHPGLILILTGVVTLFLPYQSSAAAPLSRGRSWLCPP